MMIKLDKGTYGNTPAAHILVEKIEKHQYSNYSKIGKILSGFNTCLNELKKVNTNVSIGIVHVLYKHVQSQCYMLPTYLQSYVKNLISAQYKQWLIENNANKPRKTR